MDLVSGDLRADDFYSSKHADIYGAMLRLHSAGDAIDLTTVRETLSAMGRLDAVGGVPYLMDLMNATPTAVNAEHYARIVANRALARRVIALAGKISAAGYEDAKDPDAMIDRVQAAVYEVVNSTSGAKAVFDPHTLAAEFAAHLQRLRDNPESVRPVSTGFEDIDRMLTGGMRKQEMIVIAARPSVGKTALGETIAENVSAEGKFVVFASLEMSRTQLLARRVARTAKIPAKKIIRGSLTMEDGGGDWWHRAQDAIASLAESGIWLIDKPGSTTQSLRADLSRARMRKGKNPDLIIVDYLQLLKDYAGRENDNSRIEFISGQLKQIARDFDCPVVVLSQLSRSVEHRKDRTTRLADLRGSGAIEQDADVVMFLERDHDNVYGRRGVDTKIKVLKNRNGETGMTHLTFMPDYVRFESAARPDHYR